MHQSIVDHNSEIAEICRRYGVVELDLFGSAATGDNFDEKRSDFDFLVQFSEAARAKAFDNYFGLHEDLHGLLRRPIDLVTVEQVRNPYFRAAIEASRKQVYGG